MNLARWCTSPTSCEKRVLPHLLLSAYWSRCPETQTTLDFIDLLSCSETTAVLVRWHRGDSHHRLDVYFMYYAEHE